MTDTTPERDLPTPEELDDAMLIVCINGQGTGRIDCRKGLTDEEAAVWLTHVVDHLQARPADTVEP